MEGVLTSYFNTVSPEQFKKDWEKAVGNLPKDDGPKVSEVFKEWEDFYGYRTEPKKLETNIINAEALDFYQELSFLQK